MAGRVVQPGAAPRRGQDLLHPPGGQRLPPARSLEHHENPVGAGAGRPFGVQVGGHRGEEQARHRDQPLPAALALGDEHPPLGHPQVLQPQPEDLTAPQPAQHHRRDHRPVPVRAQRRGQRIDLRRDKIRGSRRTARTSGTPWPGRDRSRRVGSPRGTGLAATSPRACKNAKKPDTIDKRRRTVAADTPPGSSASPAGCSARSPPRPVRCAVMNASTSAGRT